MSGTQDVVIAAGVESMTRVPMGTPVILPMQAGIGIGPVAAVDQGPLRRERVQPVHRRRDDGRGNTASAARSSTPSRSKATARPPRRPRPARSTREIVPLAGRTATTHRTATRASAPTRRWKAWASLKTLVPDGVITAGNASQICDGASGVLVVNERALKAHGLTPLARIDHLTVTAGDPVIMLDEPIPATRRALERSGRSIDEIDLYEVNEAFAPVPLAWLQQLGADPTRLNVNGGAIALGHPLGASGRQADGDSGPCAPPHAASASACRRCAKAAASPTSRSSRR